jgi:hypothetical protein
MALLVFAIMANGKPFVQIAHCFRQMALEMEEHTFDGVLGCFLGDRTIIVSFQSPHDHGGWFPSSCPISDACQ